MLKHLLRNLGFGAMAVFCLETLAPGCTSLSKSAGVDGGGGSQESAGGPANLGGEGNLESENGPADLGGELTTTGGVGALSNEDAADHGSTNPDSGVAKEGDGAPDEDGNAAPNTGVDASLTKHEDATTVVDDVAPGPVRAKVIDLFGNAVPGADVVIAGKATVTDTEGTATVTDVPGTYDVELKVDVQRHNREEHHVWFFLGLTRRDPTLQVTRAGALQSADAHVSAQYPETAFPDDSRMRTIFMGPDSVWSLDIERPAGIQSLGTAAFWSLTTETSGTGRALLYTTDGSSFSETPVSYLAHGSLSIAFAASDGARLSFDFTKTDALSSEILHTWVDRGLAGSWNTSNQWATHAYLRYRDGAALKLATSRQATADYTVPVITDTTFLIAATAGDTDDGPFAVSYQDEITIHEDVNMTLPTPPDLLEPNSSATAIGHQTPIRWGDSTGVHVLSATDYLTNRIFVVTAENEIRLPEFQTAYSLPEDLELYLFVQKHDDYASVDDATGPAGFLSLWTLGEETLTARRGDGSLTQSATRYLRFDASL